MNSQLDFLLTHAVQYLQSNNLKSAVLLLKQILKVNPKHVLALRMMAVACAKQGLNIDALGFINKAIAADGKYGEAYSNKGNILQNLGRYAEAEMAYRKSIELSPSNAEAYGNLGNLQQVLRDYEGALKSYQDAIAREATNPDFYCNMGNCFLAMEDRVNAYSAYQVAIELQPSHADAQYFLSQLLLRNLDFTNGWKGSESRWMARDFNSSPLKTSKPRWDGKNLSGSLLVWAEQGIGDQVLYASMLEEVQRLAPSSTVTVDAKLVPVFERSFPQCRIIDKASVQSDEAYDVQIPIGSIGQFFRQSVESFNLAPQGYLMPNAALVKKFRDSLPFSQKISCGISWNSNNPSVGFEKSIDLDMMSPIFENKKYFDFINLQYGDTKNEVELVKNKFGVHLANVPDVDLFNDMDGLLAVISACDIVITISNSIAHFSGASGKETLLLLPYSAGKFWYWQDIEGVSLWYPSVRIFRQRDQGDWSQPINEIKQYLEARFAI